MPDVRELLMSNYLDQIDDYDQLFLVGGKNGFVHVMGNALTDRQRTVMSIRMAMDPKWHVDPNWYAYGVVRSRD